MYFVICFFIGTLSFISIYLFVEMWPRWFRILIALLGIFTYGVAESKLYDQIAKLTGLYHTDYQLLPDFFIFSAITGVIVLVISILMYFRYKKIAERRAKGIVTEKEKKKEAKRLARIKKEDEEDAAFKAHEKEVEARRVKRRADRVNKRVEKRAKKQAEKQAKLEAKQSVKAKQKQKRK